MGSRIGPVEKLREEALRPSQGRTLDLKSPEERRIEEFGGETWDYVLRGRDGAQGALI